MNERIKELAQMSGLVAMSNGTLYLLPIGVVHIERFADLVRQEEREINKELVEALEYFVKHTEPYMERDGYLTIGVGLARAALAKARGTE